MDLHVFELGPLGTNCYLLENEGKAVAIDPGGDPAPILARLKERGLTLTHIINTHLHFDHTAGNRALAEATGAPILAPKADDFLLDTEVGKGGLMGLPVIDDFEYADLEPGPAEFAGLACDVLSTPGHTPGSLTLHFPDLRAAFVGDVLFYRSIGRTDFPGGDQGTLLDSVRQRIFSLPGETRVFSGHGPETSVSDEKNHNPFFSGAVL